MIVFHVTAPATGSATAKFDSLDDANAYAFRLKEAGHAPLVEAREIEPEDLPFNPAVSEIV